MSKENKKFTIEEEELLINFVKKNELIYNVQHKLYRSSELKNRLWNIFALSINKTGNIFVFVYT